MRRGERGGRGKGEDYFVGAGSAIFHKLLGVLCVFWENRKKKKK